MWISLRWLQTYVDIPWTVEELAERLTRAGLEVASVEPFGDRLEGVVIGRILECLPHPNADRLRLCRVDVGRERALQIVCGAPNVAAGQKVAVALPGAVLPFERGAGGRLPIRESSIRGVLSEGMICAEDELGLGEDHSGILVLPDDAPVGQPLAAYWDLEPDVVLEIELTPNRADAASHVGVAREISALADRDLRLPAVTLCRQPGEAARMVRVVIEHAEACPRYVAKLIDNVRVGPSPQWLVRRLRAAGMRSVNNVVDVTNFVMLEIGQPLHAFDLDKLAGPEIRVRLSRSGEQIETLDGRLRTLQEGILLICDAEKPVAIAGVMGGANSEVGPETRRVLLESAYFHPAAVRRAARQLGLNTEASYRFERGVDPEGALWAAERAAQLIAELTGAEVVPGTVDLYPRPIPLRQVRLRLSRLNALLGSRYGAEEVVGVLSRLGLKLEPESEGSWKCTIPGYRPDLDREVDLIEEVGRIRGWDSLTLPERVPLPYPGEGEEEDFARTDRMRDVLAGMGLWEVYANSLLSEALAEPFAPAQEWVRTINPISADMVVARPSLIPGLLRIVSHNQRHQQEDVRFFEFGRVFRRRPEATSGPVPGYEERLHLGIILSGLRAPLAWDRPMKEVDWFDMRGLLEALCEGLGLDRFAFVVPDEPVGWFCDLVQLYYGEHLVGWMGRSTPRLEERFELRRPVVFAELNWEAIQGAVQRRVSARAYSPFSRQPIVERDVAFVVPLEVRAGELERLLRQVGQPELIELELFDLYQGERLPPNTRSLAYRLRLAHPERTLTEAEVQAVLDRMVQAAETHLGARLRR